MNKPTGKPPVVVEFYKPGWGDHDGAIIFDANNGPSLSVQEKNRHIGTVFDKGDLRKLADAILEALGKE